MTSYFQDGGHDVLPPLQRYVVTWRIKVGVLWHDTRHHSFMWPPHVSVITNRSDVGDRASFMTFTIRERHETRPF